MTVWTPEQEHAIAAAQWTAQGHIRHLVTVAYAGGGKTTILAEMAKQFHGTHPAGTHPAGGRGLYIAFNRSIVDDVAGRFPPGVQVMTSHVLARKGLPPAYRQIVDEALRGKAGLQSLTGPQIVKATRIEGFKAGRFKVNSSQVASWARQTVTAYCQSGDDAIEAKHVPLLPHITGLAAAVFDGAVKLWNAMDSLKLPMTHDTYFKIWSLSRPQIPADFILLDEAQDTNPALSSVLFRQEAPTIWVGDPYQGIYGWRGAVDALALARTQPNAYEIRLTRSFRFGEESAAIATRLLSAVGETHPVQGTGSTMVVQGGDDASVSGMARSIRQACSQQTCSRQGGFVPQFAWISFSNASLINAAIDAADAGIPFYLVRGRSGEEERMIYAAMDLKNDKVRADSPLSGYAAWSELEEDAENFPTSEAGRLLKMYRHPGFGKVLDVLKSGVRHEREAQVILTTAHRSKGREWDVVVLDPDLDATNNKAKSARKFFMGDAGELRFDNREDIHLRYVAATRARKLLVLACPKLYRWLQGVADHGTEAVA
jgi:hypothetical protein